MFWKVLGSGPEEEIGSQPGDLLILWQFNRDRSQQNHRGSAQQEAGLSPRCPLAFCSQIFVFSKDLPAALSSALDD